ncbi:hypothetical protein AB0I81_06645 [Nonomuraea sp. NPDC050404]|uniref:hypothetical protein n=1 Tax=Nonomuraea sp. NPDC050404 TaxID=3155783 RepID=UPI003406121A
MSFKDIGARVGAELDNEFVKLRAEQIAMGEQLTEKIDGVAEQVAALDARFDARVGDLETRFDRLDTKVDGLQDSHTEMMHILIAIQRKLDMN